MNPLKLPEFFICENEKEMPGQRIIWQTSYPYIFARVVAFRSHDAMLQFITNSDLPVYSTVPGYNICVHFAGTLKGFPAYIGSMQSIQQTVGVMAQYYLDDRIYHRPGAHRRFKDLAGR
jgi:hypothetical protein